MKNKSVAIIYNSYKYVYLFRRSLINSLTSEGYVVYVIAPKDSHKELLENEGIHCIDIELDAYSKNIKSEIFGLISMFNIVKRINPIVILSYTIKINIYSVVISKILGIKNIPNVTGLGSVFISNSFLSKILIKVYFFTLSLSYFIFFQNNDDYEGVKKSYKKIYKKSLVLPGSGIDCESIIPSFTSYQEDSPMKLIFLGRIIKDKGIYELIDAIKLINSNGIKIYLSIVGTLENKSNSPDIHDIDQWNKIPGVKYLGFSDNSLKTISEHDCVILPSYREGTSRVLLEGGALGKPLLASNVPGCNNVVVDGYNGYLFDVKSSNSIYLILLKLLNLTSKQLNEMGQLSRKHIEENFKEKDVINAYIKKVNYIYST